MSKQQLIADLEFFKSLRNEMIARDLDIVGHIDSFHKRTSNEFYIPGEENQEVYTRLIRIIDSISSELGSLVAQDAIEGFDL